MANMGNAKSVVSVRIDSGVKEKASRLLANMGIDQTSAIDMFYRQIIKERKLPFPPPEKTDGTLSLDEQLIRVIEARNTPCYTMKFDGDGKVLIDDPDMPPSVYDWLMNG